jgi:hypothetical protein
MKCGTELCDPCHRDIAETSTSGVNPLAFTLPDAAVNRLVTCVPHVQGSDQPIIHAANEFRPITRFRPEELHEAMDHLCNVETEIQIEAQVKARAAAKPKVKAQAIAGGGAELEADPDCNPEFFHDPDSDRNFDNLDSKNAWDPKRHLHKAPEEALNLDACTFHLDGKKSPPYGPFRKAWKDGNPMVIRGVKLRCLPSRILAESRRKRCSIVDCETGLESPGSLTKFFAKFDQDNAQIGKVKVR